MLTRFLVIALATAGLVIVWSHTAQMQTSIALTGSVTSATDGPLEGVLVSAKQTGSTITTTVVSDAQGRYRFPSSKLLPGQYSLRIRAVGYDLDGPQQV